MSYFNRLFQGRINRRTYVVGNILIVSLGIILLIATYIVLLLFSINDRTSRIVIFVIAAVTVILDLIFETSLTIRRAHDVAENIVGIVWSLGWNSLQLVFWKGYEQENIYGQPPEPKIDIKELLGINKEKEKSNKAV